MATKKIRLSAFSGGVNLRDAPLGLVPGQVISGINVRPIPGGGLVGRSGQTAYNETPIDSNPIKSLYRFYKQSGVGITIATSGTKIYQGNDVTGAFTNISDVTYTSGERFSFVSWNVKDKVYFTNGIQPVKVWDGVGAITSLAGSPPVGSYIDLHKDRLYLGCGTFVAYSDLNNDVSWPAANRLNVSDAHASQIKFVKSFGSFLVVGTERALWRLEGSPVMGGQLTKFSSIGCIAPWSVQVTPFGIIFVGHHGVYITDGYDVNCLSNAIEPKFDLAYRLALGGWYNKRQQYWLYFPNDELWIGNRIQADGQDKIAWFQYTGHDIDSFMSWNGGFDNGEFFAGRGDTGVVRRLDHLALDVADTYTCKVQLPHLDFGIPDRAKQLRRIYCDFKSTIPISYQLAYNYRMRTGGTIFKTGETPAGIWGSSTWGNFVWGGTLLENSVTPIHFYQNGQYISLILQNTGSGPDMEIHSVELEARVKDKRTYQIFDVPSAA